MRDGGWRIVHEAGPAGLLHAGSAEGLGAKRLSRTARILSAASPALVLGSNQPESDFDRRLVEEAGLEVVRRRSGGGAVLVGPGTVLWIDLLIPAGDPLWSDDVGRAMWWVGDLWARALTDSDAAAGLEPEVWRGPLQSNPWSKKVCFASLGPGEVTLGGRKVIGVSQRRTSSGALFQTAALLHWSAGAYLRLMAGDPASTADVSELDGCAAGLGVHVADRLALAVVRLLMT